MDTNIIAYALHFCILLAGMYFVIRDWEGLYIRKDTI